MTTLADTWGIHESQFWLRGVRPDQPVQYDPATGMWNVYGYPEIAQILSDPSTFSSTPQRLLPETAGFSEGNLVQLDPPEHHKLRKLVSHAFTPKVAADLGRRIHALANTIRP